MTTLYKKEGEKLYYWEAWENEDGKSATVHYGEVGKEGTVETVISEEGCSFIENVKAQIEKLKGYYEVPVDEMDTLIIEYRVKAFGDEEDLKKRYSIEDRMQETLGWTGLGFCDGGSIGNDSMEVCCLVVDYKIAESVIAVDLRDTEYSDYSRIYHEE